MKTLPATLTLLAAVASPMAFAAEDPSAPASYQEALEVFKARRALQGGGGLSAADRAIMAEAKADLARALPDPGLKVGDRAPDFTLPDAFGEPVTLSRLLESGPVVLTFYRGAWCPYCHLELKALRDSLGHFEAQGATLVAVTPQRPDKSLEQVRADGYPFPILSDLDGHVMRAYGLYFRVPEGLSEVYVRNFGLDLAEYNGPGRYELPVPGTFVIDRDGVVRGAFAEVDYTRRMEPAAIVSALKALP